MYVCMFISVSVGIGVRWLCYTAYSSRPTVVPTSCVSTSVSTIVVLIHIISYHIISYYIIDLKWQNHLKVETDKPKLKSRCSQCQTMMSRKDFLKAMFWAGGERSIQTMKMLHLLAGHHCRQSLSASNIIKHSAFYLRGTIRWVSVFGLSNITNGYGLWMPLYRRVCDSGLLAWSKVRQPVGAVLYSPWTLGMVLPWWYHCKHCHDYSVM